MRSRRVRVLGHLGAAAAALSVVGSCSGSPVSASNALAPGVWGGAHVRLTVGAASSHLEFDCAHADIPGAFVLDDRDMFSLTGTFVREHGGPVGENETADRHPAAFRGTAAGSRMTLTIQLTDTNDVAGTFTLERGSEGRVVKCL